jgi:signal recognition particle receptor subunit beta
MELHQMLADDSLEDSVVLIVANKQDLPNAKDTFELTDSLGLDQITQKWFIQASSAIGGEGLKEGLNWVIANIK